MKLRPRYFHSSCLQAACGCVKPYFTAFEVSASRVFAASFRSLIHCKRVIRLATLLLCLFMDGNRTTPVLAVAWRLHSAYARYQALGLWRSSEKSSPFSFAVYRALVSHWDPFRQKQIVEAVICGAKYAVKQRTVGSNKTECPACGFLAWRGWLGSASISDPKTKALQIGV